jgi:hypothetical protein
MRIPRIPKLFFCGRSRKSTITPKYLSMRGEYVLQNINVSEICQEYLAVYEEYANRHKILLTLANFRPKQQKN